MLVGMWQTVLEDLEDYRAGTVISSIDYAKAFNRMSFQECLLALEHKGASTALLRLIATFLTNRVMTVKVQRTWSEERPVHGGCPQGSILGVFLFNVTTDDLEDGCVDFEQSLLAGVAVLESESLREDSLPEDPPSPDESLEGPLVWASSTPGRVVGGWPSAEKSPVLGPRRACDPSPDLSLIHI